MIDFHTHVLPGMDDGSKDIDMTLAMLKEEASQGVTKILGTPHFYAHRSRIDNFLERRQNSFSQVKELRALDSSLPEVIPGAEVYYFPGMGTANQIEELCIEGTDILLVEMPFDQWGDQEYRDISDLIRKKHLRVILAHIDRYWGLQKRRDAWESIMRLPLTRQLNADSVLSRGSTRRFALRFMKEHGRVILASDCHNMTSRAPNLQQARAFIEKKLGQEVLTRIDKTSAEILLSHDS
jgi:protein-tyrosine phosphatase